MHPAKDLRWAINQRGSHMRNMLPRHALSAGRLTGLGATRGFTTGS